MKIKLDERLLGFAGFLGFIGFTPGNAPFYMLFMMFFFFVFARPQTPKGEFLSDERWKTNITKASAIAFFVFLIPTMLNIAFLKTETIFGNVSAAIPVVAMLTLFLSFYYYDLKGE